MRNPEPDSSERDRVARLSRLGVLNAEPEAAFNRVCAIARQLADAPIAVVSFLDTEVVWCKARLGLDLTTTSRAEAFCRYGAGSSDVLWVENAAEDIRYRADPAVAGEPGLRFFAGAPVISADGARVGTVCVMDVAPRARDARLCEQLLNLAALVSDELELRASQAQLADALRAKEEALAAQQRLLSVVSHELKTPLNGALGAASLLAQTVRDPAARELASIVDASCGRLDALLDALIAFASVQGSEVELASTRFDPSASVSQALALLAPLARRRGVTLVRSEPARPPETVGDPVRFGQLVFNLVSHAITGFENATLKVEIVWRAAGTLEVTVAAPSPWPGGPQDPSAPFGSGPINVGEGGLNLGLATAERLARAMGGGVEVKAAPGGYRATARVEARSAAVEMSAREALGGGRALIVDDNRTNLLVQSRMLQALGYECRTCESGEEALDAAARQRFDVVLMDINMPGLDGYKTTERLRRMAGWAAEAPVVAVSASLPPSGRVAEPPSGFDAWLSKPLDVAKLAACLAALPTAESQRAVWRLTYVSRAAAGLDARADLRDLLVASQILNARDRITGALALVQGRFVQTLEGARDKVEATFARIAADRRHRDVAVVAGGSAPSRRFSDWTMIGAELTPADFPPGALVSAETDIARLDEPTLLLLLDVVKAKRAPIRSSERLGAI